MILHYKEDFSDYQISLLKPLKYSNSFTFIPIKLYKDKFHKCLFQTPLLFTPFGIQTTQNDKKIIDISFQNKYNDNSLKNFLKTLRMIYQCIHKKYNSEYIVNSFIKETDFGACIRLKISSPSGQNIKIFDESKNEMNTIDRFTYGNFIIQLDGLWINEKNIWFQWNLLQACIQIPIHLKEYSFIDEIHSKKEDKYDKMLKMGVPIEAVQRQKILDSKIPPPPPPPGIIKDNKSFDIPKIQAIDLQSVVLKKGKSLKKKIIKKEDNYFEPPSLEELQTTLSKLRKIN